MHYMRHIQLFIKNHLMQLKRKWLSLPLLFMFPIIIVGLAAVIIITYFMPSEKETIQVGLVNLDENEQTELIVQLIEQSSQLGSFIAIHSLTENEAKIAVENNEISSYITFPDNFTRHLMQGQSVEIPITGNPNQQAESFLVNELIESVSRHIRASQANILAINSYAREFGMDDEERNDFVFEQFKEFLFYTVGRDRVLTEREITNLATSSPIQYFAVGSWFILISIWLLTIYNFFTKENPIRLRNRMRLYGVLEIQQTIAKMFVTMFITAIFAGLSLFALENVLVETIIPEDYLRITILTLLYSVIFLQCLAIIETLIQSHKLRLLVQSMFTILSVIISGAIIPVIYYPLWIQNLLPYLFSYEALSWIQDILLNNRLYADYIPLLLMNAALAFILISISVWKERVAI
ncbi:ABC transporter permease [Oceanobacillus polygoni]|uniref:ABC-2 type transport system permease protein n=1 Tax=Oceanobacillus polygoni TaxID=1235259 RepID=A0A9X1CGH8_9BACI|nr:ABC transporter permease [Oceanobacillus polygoni]MBP2077383.1 ABC-2 type transport system permease protein [Oceanobacillus polygoni]